MKLKQLACTLSLLTVASIHAKDNADTRPNIIFILTDDLGFGDLGIMYQNERARTGDRSKASEKTPNLDRMANEGVQLYNHYCAAPVSAPSRSSILSGRSQGHAKVRDNQFDKALDNNYTLGSVMRYSGYTTAAFGKWGLQGKDDHAPDWSAHPNNRGFDYFFGYIRHLDGHEHYPKEGPHGGPKEVWENRTEISSGLDKCYTADLWTAAAKKWITEHEKAKEEKKPFLIYLAYDTPHAVLQLPTQAYPSGGGLTGGMQWTGKAGHIINTASGKIDSWIHPDYAQATYDNDHDSKTAEVAWPDVYKRYATATRRIDDAVGDLILLLKDLKIDENTMIVFTSDNGPSLESYLPEHIKPTFFRSFCPFDGIKRDCLEGGVRVPALVRWPEHVPAGKIIRTPSISYDWMATFTDMAGLPAPAITDGVSLLPSLTETGKQTPSKIYVEYYVSDKTPDYPEFTRNHRGRSRKQMQMVRLGEFVGVRYNIQSADDNFEIYNVENDPQESMDLAKSSDMGFLQRKMKDISLQSRRPDITAPRPYDNELMPSIKGIKTKAGINWKGFTGKYPWVPKTSMLVPVKEGFSDNIDSVINQMENFTLVSFDGYLQIPVNGEYVFTLNASGKSVLQIHNATIIDADYEYFNKTNIKGSVKLEAGLHPIHLTYLRSMSKKSDPALKIEWSGPGFEKQIIPGNHLEIESK